MKISLRADLRCPKGHRAPRVDGGFRAACEWCERLYGKNGIAAKAALLEQEISRFEKWAESSSGGALATKAKPPSESQNPYTPNDPPAAPPETSSKELE